MNRISHVVPLILMLSVAALLAQGCGGSSSSPAGQTIKGSVLTPGSAAARMLARSANGLTNATSIVSIKAYSVDATGTPSTSPIAETTSTASGIYTITLPAGYDYTKTLTLLKAEMPGATSTVSVRTYVSATTDDNISPLSEAAVRLIAIAINDAGRDFSYLTQTDLTAIKTTVAAAVISIDSSATINAACDSAESAAAATPAVVAALSSSTDKVLGFIATTDYTTGRLAAFTDTSSLASLPAITNAASIHSDAVIRTYGRYLFIINRYGGDNITVYNASAPSTALIQYTTGSGSNPQDIAFISDTKAYVSRYGSNSISIRNPFTGVETGTISLADFADTDGLPEMGEMVKVGNYVYVLIQNLYNYAAVGTSRVIVIDSVTDSIVDTDTSTAGTQAISLPAQNPVYIAYNATTGKIYISCAGSYYDPAVTGGLVTVDPATFATALIADKTALGGTPGDIVITSADKGYVVLLDTSYVNTIVPFNPSTGAVSASIYTAGGYVGEITTDPFGRLVVTDGSYTLPGIVFIDTSTGEKIAGPIATSLTPSSVAFISYSTELQKSVERSLIAKR